MISTTRKRSEQRFSDSRVTVCAKSLPAIGLGSEDFFRMDTKQERMAFLIDRACLQRAAFARKVRRSISTINLWVNTDTFPDDSLDRIAAALNVDLVKLAKYLREGGEAPPTLEKTPAKSPPMSSVQHQSNSRAVNGAGLRPDLSAPPDGSEERKMWERNQALERALADQVLKNQALEDQVANLQETIRGHVAKEKSAAKPKATPKPAGPK